MILSNIKNYIITECLGVRIKPRTIQLPITGKCNSRCNTCNIWKQKCMKDIDPEELKAVLKDKYFSEVRNVGINGGEPFIHKDFISVIRCLMSLKKLKSLYIISNGIMTNKILSSLEETKKICDENNVNIFLTVSLDGVDDVYTSVRGVPNGYNKVINTITKIKSETSKYCTSLTIGTTISRGNIAYITPIKVLSEKIGVPVNYHIAVPNRRIYTADKYEYSVFNDKRATCFARELFYGLFKYSSSYKQKLLYYQNYYYLMNNGKKRISACTYKAQDITLDENLNMYFCAKESECIGNAKITRPSKIIKSKNAKVENRRVLKCCNECGHYITMPNFKGAILFISELLKPSVWIRYKIYAAMRKFI